MLGSRGSREKSSRDDANCPACDCRNTATSWCTSACQCTSTMTVDDRDDDDDDDDDDGRR
jgi:hypothetical protein